VELHGPCAALLWAGALWMRKRRWAHAVAKGAEEYTGHGKRLGCYLRSWVSGGSLLYFVRPVFMHLTPLIWESTGSHNPSRRVSGVLLPRYLTHNVFQKAIWTSAFKFYGVCSTFAKIRFFDIAGKFPRVLVFCRALDVSPVRIRIR